MYLRTTKRRNADGTEVRYYQLAENQWDAARGCAVAKVVRLGLPAVVRWIGGSFPSCSLA